MTTHYTLRVGSGRGRAAAYNARPASRAALGAPVAASSPSPRSSPSSSSSSSSSPSASSPSAAYTVMSGYIPFAAGLFVPLL